MLVSLLLVVVTCNIQALSQQWMIDERYQQPLEEYQDHITDRVLQHQEPTYNIRSQQGINAHQPPEFWEVDDYNYFNSYRPLSYSQYYPKHQYEYAISQGRLGNKQSYYSGRSSYNGISIFPSTIEKSHYSTSSSEYSLAGFNSYGKRPFIRHYEIIYTQDPNSPLSQTKDKYGTSSSRGKEGTNSDEESHKKSNFSMDTEAATQDEFVGSSDNETLPVIFAAEKPLNADEISTNHSAESKHSDSKGRSFSTSKNIINSTTISKFSGSSLENVEGINDVELLPTKSHGSVSLTVDERKINALRDCEESISGFVNTELTNTSTTSTSGTSPLESLLSSNDTANLMHELLLTELLAETAVEGLKLSSTKNFSLLTAFDSNSSTVLRSPPLPKQVAENLKPNGIGI